MSFANTTEPRRSGECSAAGASGQRHVIVRQHGVRAPPIFDRRSHDMGQLLFVSQRKSAFFVCKPYSIDTIYVRLGTVVNLGFASVLRFIWIWTTSGRWATF